MRFGSRMTAAATTGPASGPLPASSQPATGKTPRLKAARSRRKLGRSGSSSSGRRGVLGAAVRLMRRDGARGRVAKQWRRIRLSPLLLARGGVSGLFLLSSPSPPSGGEGAQTVCAWLLRLQSGLFHHALGVDTILLEVLGELLWR